MIRIRAAHALWATAMAGVAIGSHGAWRPTADAVREAALPVVPALTIIVPTTDSLLDAVGVVRELELFRPERAGLDSHASQATSGMGASMIPSMPTIRPPLVLRGLVGGASLEAIVEGLPGVEGATVLRAGETVAGITLRAVRRDTAILVGKDTTWKLTVRRF